MGLKRINLVGCLFHYIFFMYIVVYNRKMMHSFFDGTNNIVMVFSVPE